MFSRRSRTRWVAVMVGVLFLSLELAGCGSLRLIPIQIARTSQTERFDFHFTPLAEVLTTPGQEPALTYEELIADRQKAVQWGARLEEIFTQLIGEENWRILIERKGAIFLYPRLYNEKIMIKGWFLFTVYLNPENREALVLESVGQYQLIDREQDNSILLSGEVFVPPSVFSESDLRSGHLDLDSVISVSNIPGSESYRHESQNTKLRLFIDTSANKHHVYQIDYDANQQVLISDQLVAVFKLQQPRHFADKVRLKLFDLRGQRFIRDYDFTNDGDGG